MKKMPWPKLTEEVYEIETWIQSRATSRGVNRTLVEYRREVEHFAAFVGSREKLLNATRKDVRAFLYHMVMDRDSSAATQARALAALKTFYDYLVIEDTIDRNPCYGIPRPSLPYRLPTVLSVSEVAKVQQVERPRRESRVAESLTIRDKAICEVLYSTGLRRAEITNLDMRRINMQERSLTTIGKGNKERKVFFNDDCAQAITLWLKHRPSTLVNTLFTTSTGASLSSRQIWWIVKKELEAAGLKGSTHTFRHSYATHLHNQGMDLLVLQKLLGHSNANTTQKYVHLSDDTLRDGYNRAKSIGKQ